MKLELKCSGLTIFNLRNYYFRTTVDKIHGIKITIKPSAPPPSSLPQAGMGLQWSQCTVSYGAVVELSAIRNEAFAHASSSRIRSNDFTTLMSRIKKIFDVLEFPKYGLNSIIEGNCA